MHDPHLREACWSYGTSGSELTKIHVDIAVNGS
jgi:hypothetical protein